MRKSTRFLAGAVILAVMAGLCSCTPARKGSGPVEADEDFKPEYGSAVTVTTDPVPTDTDTDPVDPDPVSPDPTDKPSSAQDTDLCDFCDLLKNVVGKDKAHAEEVICNFFSIKLDAPATLDVSDMKPYFYDIDVTVGGVKYDSLMFCCTNDKEIVYDVTFSNDKDVDKQEGYFKAYSEELLKYLGEPSYNGPYEEKDGMGYESMLFDNGSYSFYSLSRSVSDGYSSFSLSYKDMSLR